MKGLIRDFSLPFAMFRYVFTHKQLFFMSAIPSVVTVVALIGCEMAIWHSLRGEGFWNLLLCLGAMVISFIAGWIALGNMLLIPFIDPIIDSSQRRATGELFLPPLPFNLLRMLKEGLYSLLVVLVLIFSFPLIFVPIVGQVVGPALGMWALSMTSLAPMFERSEIGFMERARRLKAIMPATLSYGAGLWILLYIPLVNIFLLGIAQASAVDFWLAHRERLAAPSTD